MYNFFNSGFEHLLIKTRLIHEAILAIAIPFYRHHVPFDRKK